MWLSVSTKLKFNFRSLCARVIGPCPIEAYKSVYIYPSSGSVKSIHREREIEKENKKKDRERVRMVNEGGRESTKLQRHTSQGPLFSNLRNYCHPTLIYIYLRYIVINFCPFGFYLTICFSRQNEKKNK